LSRRQLPNGARIIVKVNPEVPIVAMRAAFLGGSRRETEHMAGAYHMAANCFVRGTRSRNVFEIAHEADSLGGQMDGFSGRNSFGVKGELLSKYLEDGLDLFAELLCHPTFPEEEVEKVREDTLGAIRLRKDNPGAHAFRLFEQTLYPDHPFGWDVLGTPESASRLTADDLRRLLAASSRPEELAVAVAGHVDPDLVHEFFEHALEHLDSHLPRPPPPQSPTPPEQPRLLRVEMPIEQAHVVAGFLGARITDPDRFALRIANGLLSGQGGRLFRRLRDDMGLAYAVASSCVEGLDRGYIAAYIATRPEAAETARDGLLTEFARLAGGELADEEVEDAKRKLVGGFEIGLQENAFQAAQMALDEIYGLGCRSFEAWAASVLAVSRADVIEAARRYFDRDRYACVILGPK
jgi:zinc protease